MEMMFRGEVELTNEVAPPEADVICFVKMDKGRFIGKAEAQASLEDNLPWICALTTPLIPMVSMTARVARHLIQHTTGSARVSEPYLAGLRSGRADRLDG